MWSGHPTNLARQNKRSMGERGLSMTEVNANTIIGHVPRAPRTCLPGPPYVSNAPAGIREGFHAQHRIKSGCGSCESAEAMRPGPSAHKFSHTKADDDRSDLARGLQIVTPLIKPTKAYERWRQESTTNLARCVSSRSLGLSIS